MANHSKDRTLRRVSAVTFKLRPEIGFSISIPKKYDEKIGGYNALTYYARNAGTTVSEIYVKSIFEKLKIKSYSELPLKVKGIAGDFDSIRRHIEEALDNGRRGLSKWGFENVYMTNLDKFKKEQESNG
jgi:hypothetical protein